MFKFLMFLSSHKKGNSCTCVCPWWLLFKLWEFDNKVLPYRWIWCILLSDTKSEDYNNFKKLHICDTCVLLDWLRVGCNTGCSVQILSDSLHGLLLSWEVFSKVRAWCCEMPSTSWEVLITVNFHQSPPCELSAGETPIDSNERFWQAHKLLHVCPNQTEPLNPLRVPHC